MPYENNDALPDVVKKNLPENAQTIYRQAYNNEEKYGNKDEAEKVAWEAVKKEYKKNETHAWEKITPSQNS